MLKAKNQKIVDMASILKSEMELEHLKAQSKAKQMSILSYFEKK